VAAKKNKKGIINKMIFREKCDLRDAGEGIIPKSLAFKIW